MASSKPLCLVALAACLGACGTTPTPGGDDQGGDDRGEGTLAAPQTTGGDDPPADPTTGAAPLPDPFELGRDAVRLLPFQVRFKRLQQLLGVPAEDPAFDVLRARRYELGDYNYAEGINPDLNWTATRMTAWVAAMRPVCSSAAIKARFPGFPDHLDDLMTAAYGEAPEPAELAAYDNLLGDASFDDLTRYELVCVAVLSSLEFVAQ